MLMPMLMRDNVDISLRGNSGKTHLVKSTGDTEPVILLHGLGGSGLEIILPFHVLTRLTLIAPDRPGYGASDTLEVKPGPRAQAAWLKELLDKLGIDRAIVVAHSIAAATALAFGAANPTRVKGLILLAPFCRPTPEATVPVLRAANLPFVGLLVRHALALGASWFGDYALRRALATDRLPFWLNDFPTAHLAHVKSWQTRAAELRAFNADMISLGKVAAPCHVIAARGDTIADIAWHVAWLAQHCPGMTMELLPGSGHCPHHTMPLVVSAAAQQFASLWSRH